MANDRNITITISADGTAAIAGIRQVGDETGKFSNRTTGFLDQAKQNWVAYTAVIYAAARSAEWAWNLMNEAMKVEAQVAMLDRLAKKYQTSGAEIASALQSASNSTISRADAVQVAVKGIYAGLDPTQLTKLMTITSAAALANGITVAEAYEKIAQAAETGRTRSIKQMGIIVDLTKAQEDYAARLNTTVKELTEQEKMTASVNAILASQKKIMEDLGGPADTLRTQTLQLSAAWKDLKEQVGGVLAQLAGLALRGINAVSSSFGESLAYLDHKGGASGSWGKESPPPPGPDIRAWSERQEKLARLLQRYAEERDFADASEKDKELIRLNLWFNEQEQKLRDLGASDAEYSALVAAYAAKRHADITSWANKTSDFYLDVQRANVKENDEIEKARNAALFKTAEDSVKERLAMQDAYAKAGDTETESDAIRRKAAGEREILAIRQAGLIASITEQTTFVETLKIMQQVRDLENEIEASKRVQVTDLDARRLVIEREIAHLKLQQEETLRRSNLQTAQEALEKIGGGAIAGTMGLASDIEAGKDRYMQDFKQWAEGQDARIQYLEEIGASEAAIKDAWRERDLQQEQMVQQQKLAMTSSVFGMMSAVGAAFYAASGDRNKAALAMYKTFAIAEATINTYTAFTAALKGPPGPPWSYAIAAATLAMGLAKVAQISSMQPGGGASLSAGGAGGGISVATPALQAAPAAQSTAPASPVVNIYLQGDGIFDQAALDGFARQIGPSLTKAYADGVR